jgi:hypothetical protein
MRELFLIGGSNLTCCKLSFVIAICSFLTVTRRRLFALVSEFIGRFALC